ncbi:uncharacterized protein LOC124141828 isoform X3 [Haliotis rufescens]|uniref:uncharacterized protein LOC124141828 isoform X3 n=1 Tax=Haliotis rufescens TaxID=6454 RepID=UPI00201EF874|nr:uncharacterized protein LOC124141828 isoform X3 [Haliotis rufescens]
MAGWTSLTGYLNFKPGGALSRLKSRKRMWCALEESKCQLLYYKSEADARSKPPAGEVNLKGAAITLDLDNQNQFIIMTEGKEFVLTAENHESMMIWLMALQAKRDLHSKANIDKKKTPKEELDKRERRNQTAFIREHIWYHSSSDITAMNPEGSRHKALGYSQSLHMNNGPASTLNSKFRHYQLQKIGESFDVNNMPSRKASHEKVDRSRSLPPVFEEMPPFKKRFSISNPLEIPSSLFAPYARQLSVSMDSCETKANGYRRSSMYNGDSSSGSTADSDELYGEEGHTRRNRSKADGMKRKMRQQTFDQDSDCDQYQNFDLSRSEERNRHSDSAIDKGEMGSQELGRISELEKDLIATKCELAKVMNRQTCYQDILKQKDEIILDLDEKLGQLGHGDQAYDSKKRTTKVSKEFQERVRVLQNQNRFLNEEVKRLAKLRSSDQVVFTEQDSKLHVLEADIEKWKFDYVSLIQSSIRFTGTDTMDDAELSLFGGDRHKIRVQKLLDDARKINPSLPTYERLANHDVHVDCYGFKHQFDDPGLLLHYLCQELSVHYLTQAGAYEEHQRRWNNYLRQHAKNIVKNKKGLKHLCRGGIPDQFRKQVWRQLVHDQVQDVITEKGPHYFRNLCNLVPDSPLAARYRKQVSLDLMRTMPSNVKFATAGSRGIMDMQDILLAFCIHSPSIGYCQGMNFIVGMALLFMDAQDAFWTLVAITERYFTPSYFDHNLVGAQADQLVLKDLIKEKLPTLSSHLMDIDIEVSTVTLNWFLAIFFDAVPFQTLLRIWDCFLLEGPKVLFRFSLAILKMHKKEILLKSDTISVMRHLKACAKITYDTDGLIKVAFEDMKPFTSRQNIVTKQTCYLNALKEKYKRKEIQKLAFAEREQLFLSIESESGNYLSFECCAESDNGDIWLCYGEQMMSKVCKVNTSQGVMMDVAIEFDTRVMCMLALPNNMVLYGTLSWMVFAYNMAKREKIWQVRLHDAVLSISMYVDEDDCCRVFAGLADGTVAVLEAVNEIMPTYDMMYIPIGQSPVMCVQLLGNHLWCACGNKVFIIHASTLDAMDNFTVSSNPYDHILSLAPGRPGVWISIRGSSILELWDVNALSCKMLYDTRAGKYPNLRKVGSQKWILREDDSYFNRARITAILPNDNTVWIGTGEGNLIIYEVVEQMPSLTPSEASFSENIPENMYLSRSVEEVDPYDPVRAVEERVRELYYKNLNSPDIVPKSFDCRRLNINLGDSSTPTASTGALSDDCVAFSRNKLQSSTPADYSRSPPGQCLDMTSPSYWFDSYGKSFSNNPLQFQDQNPSLFANIEEAKEPDEASDASSHEADGKAKRKLFTRETPKISESDSLLSNGDVCNSSERQDSVSETPVSSPLCNGKFSHELNTVENSGPVSESDQQDRSVTTLHDHTQSSDNNGALKECNGSAKIKPRFADMKSLSADSGIRIGSEVDGSFQTTSVKERNGSAKSSDSKSASNSNTKEVNGHTNDSGLPQGCDLGAPAQGEHTNDASSTPTKCADTETDHASAKDTESDSVSVESPNCNESFKRLRRESGQLKHLKIKQNGVGREYVESDDEVFVDAEDKKVKKASSLGNILDMVKSVVRKEVAPSVPKVLQGRMDSVSSSMGNLKPKNQETQWRIDFTGYHVDTDCESQLSTLSDLDSVSQPSKSHRPSIDSQPELKQFASQSENNLSNFNPENFIFPEDFSLEQKMAKYLQTPTFGTPHSSKGWSSFDNLSTPSRDQDTSSPDQRRAVFLRGDSLHSDVSRGTSSVSLATMAESLYAADLYVQAKVKISDKPVKCLVRLKRKDDLILSLSGSFGDDEAVLKWKRAPNEQMIWTNDPILEFCLDTNTPKLPSYMRNRMSSTSSITSNKSNGSVKYLSLSQGSD